MQLRSFCENFPLDHHHVLLYIPNSTNIQDVLKQTVTHILSTAQNTYAKILTVSYSENFIKLKEAVSKKSFCVRGQNFQSLLNQKTTEDLRCTFNCVWGYQKQISQGACNHTEKAVFYFQKLSELEKLEAPFKDTTVSYIDLLQIGAGRYFCLNTVEP